ncbi:MAG: hypothetical protein AAFR01_02050 [Pseudomonadota bacterium]
MQFVLNVVALFVEIALIGGAAFVGAKHPEWFAALAVLVAFSSGVTMDYARLAHEMPFYFGRALSGIRSSLARAWATTEALLKATFAGFIGLLTFSGTDQARLDYTAVLFAVCVLVGTSVLTRISFRWGQGALRWGYFRLALPLGILFSAGVYAMGESGLIQQASAASLAGDIIFNLAQSPDIKTASEFLFRLGQATDNLIGTMLGFAVPAEYVPIVQIVASTNVLPGFVIAAFVVAITRLVFLIQGRKVTPVQPDGSHSA